MSTLLSTCSIHQNGNYYSVGKLETLHLLNQTQSRSIGEDAMIHLLTETSTFLSLPNGCLCQITGEPLIHVSPDARSIGPTQPLRLQHRDETASTKKKRSWTEVQDAEQQDRFKRRKVVTDPKSSAPNKATPHKSYVCLRPASFRIELTSLSSSPADVYFSRVKLFYAKPNYVPHTSRFVVGLPRNRMLVARLFVLCRRFFYHRCP